MDNKEYIQQYKPAKTLSMQVQYLNQNKKVQFHKMSVETAQDKLLEYNYINIITPFKHKFAKINNKKEIVKVNGRHIYEQNTEFSEYYDLFVVERKQYPTIVENILDFEIHFKSIIAYHLLTTYKINDSEELKSLIDNLKLNFSFLKTRYNQKRISHMNMHLESLKKDISKYADIYCFFDRMSLGNMLTVFTCLENNLQNKIFKDLKKFHMNFHVDQVPDFINKVFCLVSIRNCVMHCNSLEILIRFYNPKTHELRKNSDKKRYLSMVKYLSKEKTHCLK